MEEAEADPGTMMAMSTHGRTGLGRWVLGSVTAKVLYASATPLLVIRPKEQEAPQKHLTFNSIIVPLDGSCMAEQVLPHVAQLAKVMALRVELVRATMSEVEFDRYLRSQPLNAFSTIYFGPYEEFSKEEDAQAMEYLHQVGDKLRKKAVPSTKEHLVHGHAADVIVDMAKRHSPSLVAMTTHGRAGVGRRLLGSVADKVVRHLGEPVLMVRSSEDQKEASQ